MPRLSLYGNFDITDKQYVELSLAGTYSRNKYSNMYQDDELNTSTKTTEDYYSANFYGKYGIIFPHKIVYLSSRLCLYEYDVTICGNL